LHQLWGEIDADDRRASFHQQRHVLPVAAAQIQHLLAARVSE
jgi:hypothetical protein